MIYVLWHDQCHSLSFYLTSQGSDLVEVRRPFRVCVHLGWVPPVPLCASLSVPIYNTLVSSPPPENQTPVLSTLTWNSLFILFPSLVLKVRLPCRTSFRPTHRRTRSLSLSSPTKGPHVLHTFPLSVLFRPFKPNLLSFFPEFTVVSNPVVLSTALDTSRHSLLPSVSLKTKVSELVRH